MNCQTGSLCTNTSASPHPSRTSTPAASNLVAPLLTLPPELLLDLSRFLDLGSLIVFAGTVCKPLRQLFAQFDRLSLFLVPSHRLSLAEWRRAARDVTDKTYDPTPSTESAPTEPEEPEVGFKISRPFVSYAQPSFEAELDWDESHRDLDFLQSILAYIACGRPCDPSVAEDYGSNIPGSVRPAIRSLSLVSWRGVSDGDLIQLLRTQPLLASVETVIKTERLDGRAWREATMANASQSEGRPLLESLCRLSMRPKVDRLQMRRQRGASDTISEQQQQRDLDAFPFDSCTPTQVIVQVEKRRATMPGEKLLKGEGLQIGFEGFCLEQTSGAQSTSGLPRHDEGGRDRVEGHAAAAQGRAGGSTASSAAPAGSRDYDDPKPDEATISRRLHVVLQGRYEDAGPESLEVDELFSRSVVHCNHCKQLIEL